MTIKSNLDSSHDKWTALQSTMRCESLLTRIDPLLQASTDSSSLACRLNTGGLSGDLTLDLPFFTRLTANAGLSQNAQRRLLTELKSFGIAWLGDALESNDRKPQESSELEFGDLPRFSPLQMDQPIDVVSFENAAAIELQLVGHPFQNLANSRRAKWTPGLPIDIADFEQLEKRVEVLRVVTGGKCPIGAAVCPGAVYEDLRFLIDSGFDFVTLLVDIQYEMSPASSLRLAPLEPTLEQSIKAVQDSGAKTKVLLAANLCDALPLFRCLQMGVSAVSIDAFLAHSKPKEVSPVKETFGSVLSTYVPANTGTALTWIHPAMTQLIEELRDCSIYAGSVAGPAKEQKA